MINIYFQEDVPLHPYIEPYSVVYWILFNRILKYIQSYTESPQSITLIHKEIQTPASIYIFHYIYTERHIPRLRLIAPLPYMIIQRTAINRRAALRTESDAGCRVTYIQSSQLPAVDKQIQLVCTTHGTKIIGFLPQFMYTYLIDMAFGGFGTPYL